MPDVHLPPGSVGATGAAAAWVTLALADAIAADPLTVFSSVNTSTGAFTSNATACSFESAAAQPPTYSWEIEADCSTDIGIEVWLEGLSFEIGASNGIAIVLTDSVSTSTGNGLMAAMTSTASAYRVAAGGYGSALSDVAQGALTWEVLYGSFSLILAGGTDTIGNTLGRLLDNSDPRDMGNSSAAVSATAKTPTFSGGVMTLAVAYQQDATGRSGNLGTLRYRRIPRPT